MLKKKTDVKLLETAHFRGVFCLDLTGRLLVLQGQPGIGWHRP